MGRNRNSAVGLHRHCETCYSQRCRAPVEISVSCITISCRLLCSAVFHLCKEEEHQLLCPNEKVPCLNAHYGCPFTMVRSKQAQHLEVCPASVVCCSLEWNRWPMEDMNAVFYDKILKEQHSEEQLDLSMALRDQTHLFSSLKMKVIFAELTKNAEEPCPVEVSGAVGGMASEDGAGTSIQSGASLYLHPNDPEMQELTQEEREALARDRKVTGLKNYSLWEKMFSMDKGGCDYAVQAMSNEKPVEKTSSSQQMTVLQEVPQENYSSDITMLTDVTETDLDSWEKGAINSQEKGASMPENIKYVAQNGKIMVEIGQVAPCAPKPKHFVYTYLEPMQIKTVRTFKIPTSFREKQSRIRNPSNIRKISKAVDTSDLGVCMEDIPKWDEIQATLLCTLEKEQRGHLISEPGSADALLSDIGTQTYHFLSTPFKQDDTLADIAANRALKLHVQIHAECVTNRHNKVSSAFTFLCGHFYRRDEFPSHFKNVHLDIQSGLNGWFEQRCPLAYLGCTYSQKRFQPSTHRAIVTYNQVLSTFTLRPEVSPSLYQGIRTVIPERKRARNFDSLSRLPFEVLVHIASFLDSFTLYQLALVSRLMRDVCEALLQVRGMVSLKWEKKTYTHGRSSWKSRKKVWQFSNLSSAVERWSFDNNIPSMAQHLMVCPFYQTEDKKQPAALVSMCDHKQEGKKHHSLVAMFLSDK
ncbi:F-box only protein 40-like [Conger conger]|uniref:F-box only protein 40-like n=1 Tax=Conger conger TaxID=82655 RepID=UPI002A5AD6DD|nr:F-box only protein 40-like [Conger conger]XP_061105291.1 F-box only protein 40-like [Conger conger]